MKDLRSKLAVAAVIFGLGGLGGFAIASNPAHHGQVPNAKVAAQTNQSGQRVTTGTSGAVSAPTLNAPTSQALPRQSLIVGGGQDD